MKNNKKFGGVIRNWQLHHLTVSKKDIEKVFPNKNAKPMVFTGTVVEDPNGRWKKGDHMRSSLIVSINEERTEIETLGSIYTVKREGGDIFPDLGNNALKIFY